jgi:hypothetical protein
MTIFAPSHGAHSCTKILFAVGEKDERAKMAANEFIPASKFCGIARLTSTKYY